MVNSPYLVTDFLRWTMQISGDSGSSGIRNYTPPPPPPPPPAVSTAKAVAQTGLAPPVNQWSARPAGDTFRNAWDATAQQLGTQNPIAIQSAIEQQLFRANGLDGYRTTSANFGAQPTTAGANGSGAPPTGASTRTGAADEGPDPVQLGLDLTQMALDITGLVDPTPISDGSNAVISIGRSIGSLFSGDFKEAGGHLINGAISAVAIVPVLGDAAKLGKVGKWAQTVSDAMTAVARNPAARAVLEDGMKAIKAAVDKIPQSAIDKLPASAREAIEGMKKNLDDFFAPATRVDNGTLSIGANKGATTTVNGQTVTVGSTPTTRIENGRRVATDVSGADVTVNQPRTYDSKTVNPDRTVNYTKDNRTVTYDANGFPVFKAKADLYLDVAHINSKSSDDHFKAANAALADALKADPSLAQQIGLSQRQVDHIMRNPPSSASPPDLTWHHHQDTGRMQLVDRLEHNAFPGGHLGGMRLWGGGRSG